MKNQKKKEFDALREIVEGAFNADIMSTARDRAIVNARISFANLLVERDHRLTEIGRYLGKHHATIIHYRKTFEGIMFSDKSFNSIHSSVKDVFLSCDSLMDDHEDIQEVSLFSLLKENNKLTCALEKYKSELSEMREDRKRMNSIYKLVSQRTRLGSEEEVEVKLNTWFNGLYS